MASGEANGITRGSLFTIHHSTGSQSVATSHLVVSNTTAYTADLRPTDPKMSLDLLPATVNGMQTSMMLEKELKIAFPDDVELSHLRGQLQIGELPCKYENISLDSPLLPDANLGVLLVKDRPHKMAFEINDSICLPYRALPLHCEFPCEVGPLSDVLSSAARLLSHLHRSSRNENAFWTKEIMVIVQGRSLSDTEREKRATVDRPPTSVDSRVLLRCYSSNIAEGGFDDSDVDQHRGEDIIVDNVMDVMDGQGRSDFAFEVVNRTDTPIYVSLFYFDMSNLSISAS